MNLLRNPMIEIQKPFATPKNMLSKTIINASTNIPFYEWYNNFQEIFQENV